MKIKDIENEYLAYEKSKLAKVNYGSHASIFKNYILPIIGERDIEDIQGKDIIDVLVYRQSFTHTIHSTYVVYDVLRSVIKYCVTMAYIPDDFTKNHHYYSPVTGCINYDETN